MSEITEYKCPACGGAMEFDSKSQKMKCPYCDTEMEVAEFQELTGDAAGLEQTAGKESVNQNTGEWSAASEEYWQENEASGMKVYVCESCGGEIVGDETVGATSCPFCGNRIVIKGQFSGDLKPNYIIPFKKNKKEAKAAYLRHLEKKPFLPKVFRDENHIDEIKGVYVPFWIFDGEAYADVTYQAQQVQTVVKRGRLEDTEYTTVNHYEVRRAGKIPFSHIPADASSKMEDALMDSVEPFQFKDAVPFQPAYLAGYLAERYDVKAESCFERAKERMKSSVSKEIEESVKGYTSKNITSSQIDIRNAVYSYALYPVWILNTSWKGSNYIFAMNGQTGKMVGDLPADKGLFRKYVFTRAIGWGAAIYAAITAFLLFS